MSAKFEMNQKPFGMEILWAETESYIGKCIYLNPGEILGLRYHKKNYFTIYSLTGGLRVWKSSSSKDFIDLEPGKSFHGEPMKMFRMSVPEGQDYPTVFVQVSTNFPEDLITVEKKVHCS
tara:strand:+ start:377 stop:736 length:360 start_codon:yes stop_codon:yes gene_type:complete